MSYRIGYIVSKFTGHTYSKEDALSYMRSVIGRLHAECGEITTDDDITDYDILIIFAHVEWLKARKGFLTKVMKAGLKCIVSTSGTKLEIHECRRALTKQGIKIPLLTNLVLTSSSGCGSDPRYYELSDIIRNHFIEHQSSQTNATSPKTNAQTPDQARQIYTDEETGRNYVVEVRDNKVVSLREFRYI